MFKGIDDYNGTGQVDYAKVKADGINFVMVKCSEGTTIQDKRLSENLTNAAKAGVHTGVYHYMHATTPKEVKQEADYLLSTIRGCKFEYPAALDVEAPELQKLGKSKLTDLVVQFLDLIRTGGYYPMLYTSLNWTRNFIDMSRINYDLWLAQYYSTCTYGKPVGIWQYSEAGQVNGVGRNVDVNISYKDYPTIIRALGLNLYPKRPFKLDTRSTPVAVGHLYQVLSSQKPDSVDITGRDRITASAPYLDRKGRGWMIDIIGQSAGCAHITVVVGKQTAQCNFTVK